MLDENDLLLAIGYPGLPTHSVNGAWQLVDRSCALQEQAKSLWQFPRVRQNGHRVGQEKNFWWALSKKVVTRRSPCARSLCSRAQTLLSSLFHLHSGLIYFVLSIINYGKSFQLGNNVSFLKARTKDIKLHMLHPVLNNIKSSKCASTIPLLQSRFQNILTHTASSGNKVREMEKAITCVIDLNAQMVFMSTFKDATPLTVPSKLCLNIPILFYSLSSALL